MYDVPTPCPTCGDRQHPPCALCGAATRCSPDDPGEPFAFCDPCYAELEHPELLVTSDAG